MKVVIGGSGYIGSNLCDYFSKKKELFVGTYNQSPKKGLKYFDLKNPDLRGLGGGLDKVDVLFLCSAVCKIDECKKNEETAYRVNVDGTQKIINQCFKEGLLPVFFSSDYVFNGERGNYKESDKTNPCTVYGTHKKIIEDLLLGSDKPFLIARISKIYGLTPGDNTHFFEIAQKLKNNETLYQATDQKISPTYIQDLVRVLDSALEKGLRGLYNIAAPKSYSRFELADMVKSRLNINSGKIIPCSIKDFKFFDNRPLNTSLNSEKIIKETGFRFQTVEESINKLKKMIL